jgi:hypothetical protein
LACEVSKLLWGPVPECEEEQIEWHKRLAI